MHYNNYFPLTGQNTVLLCFSLFLFSTRNTIMLFSIHLCHTKYYYAFLYSSLPHNILLFFSLFIFATRFTIMLFSIHLCHTKYCYAFLYSSVPHEISTDEGYRGGTTASNFCLISLTMYSYLGK